LSDSTAENTFTAFMREVQPRVAIALAAALGQEAGQEATAEAFTYAWEHWDRVGSMKNPAGYVYRVGRSRVRRWRIPPAGPAAFDADHREPWVEPGLRSALGRLSPRQRTVVVLMEGYGHTPQEVADLLGVSRSSVRRHSERALRKLRSAMGVTFNA
jgi:DNA-directed RNA polymerase specialized sigma24 family protein